MRSTLLYLLQAWVVCTLVGLAVLAPLRQRLRDLWLPASPVLGVAFLVVGLHWTSIAWGTATGIWLVLGAAVALVVLGVVRGTRPWRFSGPAALAAAVTSLIGLGGALLALVPNGWLGSSRVVLPTPNNDAFYYISEAVWLKDHPFTTPPVIGPGPGSGTESPLGTSAAQAILAPLRVGQPLASSGIHGLFGSTDVLAFMPTMAAYIMMTAGAVFVAMRLLGANPLAGGLAAALVCTSATTVRAAYDTHADSLLGIALVLVTIGAVVAATMRHLPRWPAVVLTAGLVGAYAEYLVFLLPVFAAAAFLVPGRGYLSRMRRGVTVGMLSVFISPMAWWRAIRNLLLSNSGGDTFPSPFLTDTPALGAARALGSTAVTMDTFPRALTLALAGMLVVGCLAVLVLSRYGIPVAAALAVGLVLCWYATVTGRGYLQDRLVTLTMPLVWVAAVLGWQLVVLRLRRRGARSPLPRWTAVTLAVAVTAVACGVNATSATAALDPTVVRARAVTGEFDDAAGWVRELGGPEGENVTVAVPDLFDQMWLVYELRDDDAVSFLSLHQDYLRPENYWNGEVDRYILVGSGVALTSEAGVVRRSAHFRLVDTTRAPVTVVAPTEMNTWWPFPEDAGALGGSGSGLVVLRGPRAGPPLTLHVGTTAPGTPLQLAAPNGATTTAVLGAGTTEVPVPDSNADTERIAISTPGVDSVRTIRLDGATSP
jgi:hypothetical protein